MWKKMDASKNAYLQKTFPKENPRVISKSLNRAFKIDSQQLAKHERLALALKSENGVKPKKNDHKSVTASNHKLPDLV